MPKQDGRSLVLRLPDEAREEVWRLTEERLRATGSPILRLPQGAAELRSSVDAMLDEIAMEIATEIDLGRVGHGPVPAEDDVLAAEIGTRRAAMAVPPAESLYAARVLFEVALPVLVGGLCGNPADPADAVRVAVVAQRTIMRRVGRSSVAYVDFLLDRLQFCRNEERRRVARDLHDKPAHGLGVGLQSLELHALYAAVDPARSEAKLQVAREALLDALQAIRTIAVELRDVLGQRDLGGALTAYLEHAAPPGVEVVVRVDVGRPGEVPPAVAEELYLVLREALYNAIRHGKPSVVRAVVTVEGATVHAEVVDDGCGFDASLPSGGIGLCSMQERAQLLGGTVEVLTGDGRGTRVRVTVPLPKASG